MELPNPPSFRLDGKSALVTGAGRGIGAGVAAALAAAGAHVVCCARTSADVEEVAAAIAARGGKAAALVLDVSDLDAVKHAFATRPAFDILFNNAGTNRPKTFLDVTREDYDAVLDLNLRAAFFVAQEAAARMVAEGRAGSIIHTSSQMGHVGGANRSLYCASKWAIEGLTKAMALDLARHNIRVNNIAPTFIETPMTKPFLADQAFRDATVAKIKLGRLGLVEDVTGAVVFLASDAAALITGTSIVIDGGWTAD